THIRRDHRQAPCRAQAVQARSCKGDCCCCCRSRGCFQGRRSRYRAWYCARWHAYNPLCCDLETNICIRAFGIITSRRCGWVVKSGIKFCVDYLLYKRGPVFQHAEFAIVVIPVYEDPEDQVNSPFKLQNTEPFTWPWLSTINRVDSQVQKTLVLSYITIPAESRVSPKVLFSPACFAHYSVRD
ncbi:tRNA intron endonuclease, partial [Suillus lakei]